MESRLPDEKNWLDDDVVPELPAPSAGKVSQPAIPEQARTCKQCGGRARIVSNQYGVHAYCGPCKIDWPIALPASCPSQLPTIGRGIRKISLTNPEDMIDMAELYGDD